MKLVYLYILYCLTHFFQKRLSHTSFKKTFYSPTDIRSLGLTYRSYWQEGNFNLPCWIILERVESQVEMLSGWAMWWARASTGMVPVCFTALSCSVTHIDLEWLMTVFYYDYEWTRHWCQTRVQHLYITCPLENIYLSTPPTHISIHLSIHPIIHLSRNLFTHLSISINLSNNPSSYLSIC